MFMYGEIKFLRLGCMSMYTSSSHVIFLLQLITVNSVICDKIKKNLASAYLSDSRLTEYCYISDNVIVSGVDCSLYQVKIGFLLLSFTSVVNNTNQWLGKPPN